jgi:hypothetical protein
MAKQTFTAAQVLTAAQMNALQSNDFNQTVTTKTASYTPTTAVDAGTRLIMNAAGATTITINTSIYSAGDTLTLLNIGAGVCTLTAGTCTISSAGPLAIPQYGGGTLFFSSASAAVYFPSAGPAASSGLTLITAATSSATSSLTIANCFSASYRVYQVHLYQISMGSSNQAINLRYGTSGTPDTSSNYWLGLIRIDSAGNLASGGSASAADKAQLGGNYGNFQGGTSINLTISNPFDAKTTWALGQGSGNYAASADAMYNFNINTQMNTTTSYTDLVLFPTTSTITVNYAVYGLAAS